MYSAQISDLISSLIIYLCGFVLFFKHFMDSAPPRSRSGVRGRQAAGGKAAEEVKTEEVSDDGKGGDQ